MTDAVIYLGSPRSLLADRRLAACEEYARRLGLTVRRIPDEPGRSTLDWLRDAGRGAAVILDPQTLPPDATRRQLSVWLAQGSVVDSCEGGLGRAGIEGLRHRALVFGIGTQPDAHERARRWAECRAYAERLGFPAASLNAADNLDTPRGRPRAVVVILHPECPDLQNRTSAPLTGWLLAGATVHAVPLPVPPERPVPLGDVYADPTPLAPAGYPQAGQGRSEGTPQAQVPVEPGERIPAPGPGSGGIIISGHAGAPAVGSARPVADRGTSNTITGGTYQGQVFQVGDVNGSVNIFTGAPGRPGRDDSKPLPRDGLFIRRNNAFGTRSTTGITELIENGVMVDQEQIRFDDFLATRTEEIPGPAAGSGEAVAVSHGWAPAPPGARARAAATHFVELAVKAADAPTADLPAAERLAVNFVFVVDTSSSMQGAKLDAVRSALREVHGRLRDEDHLGVVTFDTEVRTVLRAVRKRDLGADRFEAVIAGLRAWGATDVNLGLQYGIDEIARNSGRSGRTVDCLYLFSDGDPTSGLLDWLAIRRNVAERLRAGITLSCFGFGSDARMRELGALAGIAGGHSTFVTRPEDVHSQLHSDLNRRDQLAAIDVQLKIELAPGVDLWHVYGHDLITDPAARRAVEGNAAGAARRALADYGTAPLPDLITDEDGIRIFSPDLAYRETYWVVLEVALPAGSPADSPTGSPTAIGTATVQYVDAPARANRSHRIDLAVRPSVAAETVAVHAIGLRTSEVTFDALDDLYENDRPAATARLRRHIALLEEVETLVPGGAFSDDRVVLGKLVTLSGNLGLRTAMSDAGYAGYGGTRDGGPMAYSVMMMNRFGRVRSGYNPVAPV